MKWTKAILHQNQYDFEMILSSFFSPLCLSECKIDNCEACFNRNFCTKCKEGLYSHSGRCYVSCPPGQRTANETMECVGEWPLTFHYLETAASLKATCCTVEAYRCEPHVESAFIIFITLFEEPAIFSCLEVNFWASLSGLFLSVENNSVISQKWQH